MKSQLYKKKLMIYKILKILFNLKATKTFVSILTRFNKFPKISDLFIVIFAILIQNSHRLPIRCGVYSVTLMCANFVMKNSFQNERIKNPS